MPRASDGTVTLPVGNPVVSGTAISADVQNATVADLASMIEDSLSRSGKGGMTVAIQNANGTVNAPGVTFDGDTDTGLYNTANHVLVAAGGTETADFSSTGVAIPGTMDVTGATTVGGTLAVTGKITATGGITQNLVISPSSGSDTGTSNIVDVDAPNLTASNLVCTGGRVKLELVAENGGAIFQSYIYLRDITADYPYAAIDIWRSVHSAGSWTKVSAFRFKQGAGGVTLNTYELLPGCVAYLDNPGAGAWDYKVMYRVGAATTTVAIVACQLIAYEL